VSQTRTPRLILICGPPGAGKSTLAREIAEGGLALRLSVDEWMAHLGFDLWDVLARDRIDGLFWQLAQQLLALGQSVILESGFWLRTDRDEKRLGARALGARAELHYLDVGIDERWRRIEVRNASTTPGDASITREQLEGMEGFFDAPQPAELELFDVAE
jgi:predicted kinase